VGRVGHGVRARVDRLRCLGNAVVPRQAEAAWHMLAERFVRNRADGCESNEKGSRNDTKRL
jgi:hypothetical protein